MFAVRKTADRPLVHAGRLVPVYPQHDIINTKWLREKMTIVKDAISLLPETLPAEVLTEEKLISHSEAIAALHFPENPGQVAKKRGNARRSKKCTDPDRAPPRASVNGRARRRIV